MAHNILWTLYTVYRLEEGAPVLLIRERVYCRWWKRQKTTMRDAQVWKAEVGGGVYVDGWIDVWMERVRER